MTNIYQITESPNLQQYYTLPTEFNHPVSFLEMIKLLHGAKENMVIAILPKDSEPQLAVYIGNYLEYASYISEDYGLNILGELVEISDCTLSAKYKILGYWTGEVY